MKFRILILLIAGLTIFSCKQKEKKLDTGFLPEDFEIFYEKFHTDSLFQLEHIQWPLEGATGAKGGNIDLMVPVKWPKEGWTMHKPFNDHNQTFKRQFYYIGPAIVEKISDNGKFFAMERRFAKFDDEWQLIYYSVSN